MNRLTKLCRAKYSAARRALNPLFVVVKCNVGFTELLGLASLGLVAWSLGLMWFPLAPLCLGLAGMAVAVINARMRK